MNTNMTGFGCFSKIFAFEVRSRFAFEVRSRIGLMLVEVTASFDVNIVLWTGFFFLNLFCA